jgi:hypothetical protein
LTFHEHPETFTGQENQTFIGTVGREGEDYVFDAERALADFSCLGTGFSAQSTFFATSAAFHRGWHRRRRGAASPFPRSICRRLLDL